MSIGLVVAINKKILQWYICVKLWSFPDKEHDIFFWEVLLCWSSEF
jgi:hypothetical protein